MTGIFAAPSVYINKNSTAMDAISVKFISEVQA